MEEKTTSATIVEQKNTSVQPVSDEPETVSPVNTSAPGNRKVVFDAGCGQGYYDRVIKDRFPDKEVFGIDISKFAVKYAASHNKDISYAVAGVYDMPVRDNCADIVLSVFSPIADKEFLRVSSHNSHLLIGFNSSIYFFFLS